MKILYTVLGLLLFSGCTTTLPYRTNYTETCYYKNAGDCYNQSMTIGKGEKREYRLSFLEFDDQGMIHLPDSRRKIMEQYRKIAKTKDVLLITFIHGWHHNAQGRNLPDCTQEVDPDSHCGEDSDIVNFREALAKAADYHDDKEVLGVYIGWRGRALGDFLDYATFWDRKRTAHIVGQEGIAEALLELEHIVKRDGARPNNKMITMGHSFGGAALYSAMSMTLANRYVTTRGYRSNESADGFGDLVVLLNPAFEALRYSTLFELSQADCREFPEKQLPKLIILSSYNDSAVKWLFQTARAVTALFETHRSTYATWCTTKKCNALEQSKWCNKNEINTEKCKALIADGQCPYDLNQFSADRHAVGHYRPYITHDLYAKKHPKANTAFSVDKKIDIKQSWQNGIENDELEFNYTILKSRGISRPFSPYMNIFTDDECVNKDEFNCNEKIDKKRAVMKGHNKIWSVEVKDFINEIIKLTGTN